MVFQVWDKLSLPSSPFLLFFLVESSLITSAVAKRLLSLCLWVSAVLSQGGPRPRLKKRLFAVGES